MKAVIVKIIISLHGHHNSQGMEVTRYFYCYFIIITIGNDFANFITVKVITFKSSLVTEKN